MPKTLLLADDSVVIQKLVALSFANEDIQLVTVYNGDDAVEKVRERHPDLVLADVVMPGKNGYEVCEAIKADPELARIPVLLLTGTFEAFDEERARAAGADGHITKPFEAQALVERVSRLLDAAAAAAAPPPPVAERSEHAPEQAAALDVTEEGVDDFFDDDVREPLAEPEPEPAADAFALAGEDDIALDPLATGEDLLGDLDSDAPSDHTIALMSDEADAISGSLESFGTEPSRAATADLALGAVGDKSSGLGSRESQPNPRPADSETTWLSEDDLSASRDPAADSFSPITAPDSNANPDPLATVLTDDELSLTPPIPHRPPPPAAEAQTMLADELFSPEHLSGPHAASGDPDQDFDFATASPVSFEPPADLALDPTASEAAAQAEIDPLGRSDFDISSSDLGDPLASSPPEGPATPAPAAASAPEAPATPAPATASAPEAPATPAPATASAPEAPATPAPATASAPEAPATPATARAPEAPATPAPATASAPEAPETRPPEPTPSPTPEIEPEIRATPAAEAPSASAAAAPPPTPAIGGTARTAPDLSDVMQDRLHETLEKVAWEAFSDLSETIVRQVLERVERVAWEVIPQMAEALIQEEIRKLKEGDE